MATLQCPQCGPTLKHRPDVAGQNRTCPRCGGALIVPAEPAPPEPPPAEERCGLDDVASLVEPWTSACTTFGAVCLAVSGMALLIGLAAGPLILAFAGGAFSLAMLLIVIGTLREIRQEVFLIRRRVERFSDK